MIFVTGLLLLALIGVPLFALFGAAALGSSLELHADSWSSSAIEVFDAELVYDAKLAAIPLFAFAGGVLVRSGAPRRIWRLAQAWLGWLPSGQALAVLPTAAFIGAFAGGNGAGAASYRLLPPALVGAGYSEQFATRLVTAGGAIGLLFAPSLALLLYGPVAGLNMPKAVVAGIVPGLLALGLLAGYLALTGAPSRPDGPRYEVREAVASLRESKWELLLVALIIGGVASGVVRLHEAAALTVLYVLAVEVLVHRDVDPRRDLPRVVVDSAAAVGAVLLLLAIAIGAFVFLVQGEPLIELMSWMQGRVHSSLLFLLIVNALLLVVGMAVDAFTTIVVAAPLVDRLAGNYGIDPYHLTAIVLLNLAIGCLTRPIAYDLFVAPPRSGPSAREPYQEVAPFVGVLLVLLLVVTCVPAVATWLPDQIGPQPSSMQMAGSSAQAPAGSGSPSQNVWQPSQTAIGNVNRLLPRLDSSAVAPCNLISARIWPSTKLTSSRP